MQQVGYSREACYKLLISCYRLVDGLSTDLIQFVRFFPCEDTVKQIYILTNQQTNKNVKK